MISDLPVLVRETLLYRMGREEGTAERKPSCVRQKSSSNNNTRKALMKSERKREDNGGRWSGLGDQ